ncbi:MAG: NAD-dependent protein deacylase [Christensenellales bacterium]|jgi:NAD-dependent deacetylase
MAAKRLKEMITNCDSIVFLGGAGVSTESGIPDFRSAKGIFNAKSAYRYPPETMLSNQFFVSHPEIFFDYYRSQLLYPHAEPNDAHKALAELERRGQLKAIVTQNIDGLHQKAGSKNVLELHGTVLSNTCRQCGAHYGLSFILQSEGVPSCTVCKGVVKPDVVLYGESLDEGVITQTIAAIEQADMLIVGGTSLNVYPAAGFVRFFKGKYTVIINKSATSYDETADLLIHESIAKVLREAVF